MTARDLRRAGLAPDPLGVVLTLLAVALLAASQGCSPSNPIARVFLRDEHRTNAANYADNAPHVAVVTSGGVTVDYPVWLDFPGNDPVHKAEMLREIAETPPDADPRIDPRLRGVPAGLTVVVLSGPLYTPASPTGRANGLTAGNTIYVAWRSDSRGLRLPALGHELRHWHTGDPLAGH